MIGFDAWLDRRALAIARRVDGPEARAARDLPADRSGDELADGQHPGERVSRAEVLASGAVLVTGLAGLRMAGPTAALGASSCDRLCDGILGDKLRDVTRYCNDVWPYNPGRTLDFLFKNATEYTLGRGTCIIEANVRSRLEHSSCVKRCAADDKRRAKGNIPKPPRPPRLHTPQTPVTPTPTPGAYDACANCESVGGKCCGATRNPDGSVSITACNNPTRPC